MADITMCLGEFCSKRENCYRYTATANDYWQSWFMEVPVKDDGECEHYWPTEENE